MIRSFLAVSLGLFLAGCKSDCETDPNFRRIEDLCQKLSATESPHLTATELAQFTKDISKLNQVRIGQAMNTLDEPDGESRLIPSRFPGEPYPPTQENASKAPMKILAAALVRKHPTSTTLTNFIYRKPGFSKAEIIIEELVAYDPKRAWEYAQDHRQFILGLDPSLIQAYAIVTPIFSELAKQNKLIRFEFLKQGSRFQGKDAAQFHRDALYGLFRGSRDDTAQLEEFLDWLTEPDGRRILKESSHLSPPYWDFIPFDLSYFTLKMDDGRRNFPTFDFDLQSQALCYLATQDPRKAIRWATSKKSELSTNWPVSIFAGWLSYWPTTPNRIPDWESRISDALDWVALNDRNPPQDLVAAISYLKYAYEDDDAQMKTFSWVYDPSPNPEIEKTKAAARTEIREILMPREQD